MTLSLEVNFGRVETFSNTGSKQLTSNACHVTPLDPLEHFTSNQDTEASLVSSHSTHHRPSTVARQ